MAEEPQPSNVHEGATVDETPLPTNAEDRKTAAALSSLESRGGDDDDGGKNKAVDTEALGKAMKNLDSRPKAGREVPAKKIKVDQADVTLLVRLSASALNGQSTLAEDTDRIGTTGAMPATARASRGERAEAGIRGGR